MADWFLGFMIGAPLGAYAAMRLVFYGIRKGWLIAEQGTYVSRNRTP